MRAWKLSAAAWVLVGVTAAAWGCAPDAVLGRAPGTGGSATTSSTSGSSSSGMGAGTSSSSSASSSSGSASTSSTSGSASSSGSSASASSSGSSGSSASSSGTGGGCTTGCTTKVLWAKSWSPTGLALATPANDASGVGFTNADDVFVTGQMAAATPAQGFLTLLEGATGAQTSMIKFGDQGNLSAGVAASWGPATDVMVIGGVYQGTPPFGLTGMGPTSFAAQVSPTNATLPSASALNSQIATAVAGPNDAPASLGLDCLFTLGGATVSLITSGVRMCSALAFDPSGGGSFYVGGTTTGDVTIFGGPNGGTLLTSPLIFIEKISVAGQYLWSLQLGSSGGVNEVRGLAVTKPGHVVLTGRFSASFQVDAATVTYASDGSPDAYLLELDAAGKGVWGFGFGGTQEHIGRALAADPVTGDLVMVGDFSGAIDLPGGQQLVSMGGSRDVLVMRLADSVQHPMRWKLQLGDSSTQLGEAVAISKTSGDIAVSGQFDGAISFAGTPPPAALMAQQGTGGYVIRLAP